MVAYLGYSFHYHEIPAIRLHGGAFGQVEFLDAPVEVLQWWDLVGEGLVELLAQFDKRILAATGDALVLADRFVPEEVQDREPALRLYVIYLIELGFGQHLPLVVELAALVLCVRPEPRFQVD